MKRIISVVITLAVLVGCMAVVGDAASTVVKKVNLFSDVPYAGRTADFTAMTGADAVEMGYSTYFFNELEEGRYSSVQWYDKTGGFSLKEGDTFIKGHEYRLRIGVTTHPGFDFAYNRTVSDNGVSSYWSSFDEVTLNGENVAVKHFSYKNYKEYLYVERDFSPCTDAPEGAIVDTVEVKNIDYPMAGNSPDFDATTHGDFYGLHGNGAYAVNWYTVKGEFLISMDEDDVFVAGNTYRVDVTLTANYGCRFKYDNPETPNMISATINGIRADYAKNFAYVRPVPEKELKISYTFPPCPGDVVSHIEISGVDEPMTGMTPSYDAVLLTDACVFSGYEDSKNVNGICWYDYTERDFLKKTDTFIEGHEYGVTFEIFAEEGYRFDKGNVTATVNGNDAMVRYYTEGDTKHYVEYIFSPCFGGERITRVDITDVVAPVSGETPVYTATAPEGCKVSYIDWGCVDILELIEPDNRFEDGNTYEIILRIEVEDAGQFRFGDGVTVTVNGKEAQVDVLKDGRLWVIYTFPPCIEGAVLPVPGDADGNGTVNLLDASAVMKHVAKWSVEIDLDAAEVTDDGRINLGDVSAIMKYIARWDIVLK